MPVQAIIKHGNIPDVDGLVDEPNLLVQSLTISATREEKLYKGATTKATQGILLIDPRLSFAFKAIISEFAGLADEHPGEAVTGLLNFADAIHGFDPEEGILVYKEPSRDLSIEDPAMTNFTVEHFPFVEPAVTP